MRTPLLIIIACAALPMLIVISPGSARSDNRSAHRLTKPYEMQDPGQRLYIRQGCYQCHGLVGQGSILSGPSLAPVRLDNTAFRRYVRRPKGAMPPYSVNILPETDLGLIEAYIRSIPRSRGYASVPMLAAAASSGTENGSTPTVASGNTLYQRNCAMCHGAAREGGVAPRLDDEGTKRNVAAIATLIMTPPSGMPKLYPDPLSRPEVDAIAEFVKSGR